MISIILQTDITDKLLEQILSISNQQMIFATLAVAFGILHLILFLFSPRSKSNLFFAIFVFLYAANIYFDYQNFISMLTSYDELYLRLHRIVMPYNSIFALLFLYSLFEEKIPKQFWIISLVLIVTGALSVIEPIQYFSFVQFALIAVTIETARIIILSVKNKKEGARIIALGFIFLFIFSSYDLLIDLGVMYPINNINNGYPFGFAGLIICISVFLASDFAKTSERMVAQERRAKELEIERRLLEAEDARKTRELEEARQLQLSMLPICNNDIAGIDICFHMDTATEVGGDYYDYKIASDDTLTVVIGDATGHGTKAGTMVSIIKSLFISDTSNEDLFEFLKKCSQTIKQMKLGNLFMGLQILKYKNHSMVVSSAGMPPIYIYRSVTDSVEEIVIKSMPLGGPSLNNYEAIEKELNTGDVILLMSDGYPELFNEKNEMLGYLKAKEVLKESAQKSAAAISSELTMFGEKWRGERTQEDDITIVVIKIK
jgi:serine phosphatase RsbU (regulator of sigma subunit)